MHNDRLYICETCERDVRIAADELTRGQQLVAAIERELAERDLEPPFSIRVVSCLNGCLKPCNVALRARGKYQLRFSKLTAAEASAVIDFALLYADSTIGDPDASQWPAVLRERNTVRVPPLGLVGD